MPVINSDALAWEKGGGLLPAIIQHANTGQVLMLGYMNADALAKTLDTKKVTFYSRSKDRLWTKGEISGNWLDFVSAEMDCDADTILIQARPHGPACLTPSLFMQFSTISPAPSATTCRAHATVSRFDLIVLLASPVY